MEPSKGPPLPRFLGIYWPWSETPIETGVEISIKNVPEGILYWSVQIADVETGYGTVFNWMATVLVGEKAICENTLTQYSHIMLFRIWEDVSGYPSDERILGFYELPVEDGKRYTYDWADDQLSEGGQ